MHIVITFSRRHITFQKFMEVGLSLIEAQLPKKRWLIVMGVIASITVFVVASAIMIGWLGPESNDTQVIEEWNATISKLGIDPVFPPEEDVAVGDIYAVLDDREGQQSSRTALALRSIRLDHKDLTKDIEQAQREAYLFPVTPPRSDDQSKPWNQTPNDTGIMTRPDKRTTLPIAAFPGFTIRQQRDVRGGLLGWLSTTFGFQSDRGVELSIPVAETYGIPSFIAVGELEQFCADKDYPNRCTDQTLRRHLAFVTPRAFELKAANIDVVTNTSPVPENKSKDPKLQAPSADRYRYPLEVVLVNRVYLARYIDQSVKDSRAAATRIGSTKQTDRLTARAAEGTDQRAAEDKDNGAALTFSKEEGQGIKQTFLRPIVIGYRAVKRVPKEDIVETASSVSSDKVNSCLNNAGSENPDKGCRVALGSVPQPGINAAQPTGTDKKPDTDDPKRYRLYLHTAGQPEETIAKARDALRSGGYAVQGEDALANDDKQAGYQGAGVDYFNDADGIGATSVSKLVTTAIKNPVPRRRQNAYNPIGVLGVWLPIVDSKQAKPQ
jgi:hypothetical protein